MPSDKNQHGQHQGQHQGQHGQTYDQSGQPTSPAPGGGQPNPNQQDPRLQQEERERQERYRREREQRPDQPPGQDHPAHRDTPPERQQAGQDRPPPAQDKAATEKAAKEAREASQAASIGAQIILDYNSDAGVAARGGAGATIEENSAIRDANLMAVGLNPMAPSGPPTGEPWEPPVVQAAAAKHVGPSATKMSSLAAGIQEVPTPPPPAARH